MRSGTSLAREMLRLGAADWAMVAVPAALALLLAMGGNALRLLLRYERDALGQLEQLWRLLTAHVVHMNPSHLLLDGVALVLIWLLFVKSLPARVWWAAFFAGCLAIDGGLYLYGLDVETASDPYAAFEGRLGGELRVISTQDGTERASYVMKVSPVFDGLIAADS